MSFSPLIVKLLKNKKRDTPTIRSELCTSLLIEESGLELIHLLHDSHQQQEKELWLSLAAPAKVLFLREELDPQRSAKKAGKDANSCGFLNFDC